MRHEAFRERLAQAESRRERHVELGRFEAELGARLEALDHLRDELAGERRRLEGEEAAFRERRRRRREAVRRLAERVEEGLRAVRARTYGRLDRNTEEESPAALAEELDALAEKGRAVQAL